MALSTIDSCKTVGSVETDGRVDGGSRNRDGRAVSSLRLIVASHKPYKMPEGDVYLPLQVGAAGKNSIPGLVRDDQGENISAKNANWCELTGLYWAWKNVKADAVGLVHYRRLFAVSPEEIQKLVNTFAVVVPKPRNYWIETNYSQYVHAHHAQDLDVTRVILVERHPDFVAAFDAMLKSTKGHRFNMFAMTWPLFDDYCTWLFDVLFELERRLDISDYSPYDARVFGFVSERLLDVWLQTRGIRPAEVPVQHLEGQNWPRKIVLFLKRKFVRK